MKDAAAVYHGVGKAKRPILECGGNDTALAGRTAKDGVVTKCKPKRCRRCALPPHSIFRANYPFSPVIVMPSTKKRWHSAKSTSTGMVIMVAAANINGHSATWSSMKACRPRASGILSMEWM